MVKHLSPEGYTEAYDHSPHKFSPIETAISGFVGLTEKGPAGGSPTLITSYAEYTKIFGGYLSESVYGKYRFLPGAVEHFFQNGGTRCYIVRVLPVKAIEDILSSEKTDKATEQILAASFIGEDHGPGKSTGIPSFLENKEVSIIAVPGVTIPEVITSLTAHCENMQNRFAIIDMPKDLSNTDDLLQYRNIINSTYAAMYHPWIQCYDRATLKPGYFPPSGAIAGIYSRSDATKGVHKAPANETISCTGLKINYSNPEQDILNHAGVNLIRVLPDQGICVWEARTASNNASFKYIDVRRLFIYIEETIKANTSWVIFEANDETLWGRVKSTVTAFLNTIWKNDMLVGSTPEEAYFVNVGPSTMSMDDISNGRLIIECGIAPSRPAEFVIF